MSPYAGGHASALTLGQDRLCGLFHGYVQRSGVKAY